MMQNPIMSWSERAVVITLNIQFVFIEFIVLVSTDFSVLKTYYNSLFVSTSL